MADLYHFYTDPETEYDKIRYASGSRPNFDMDPGKNDMDPDPGKQGFSTRQILNI